MPRHRAVPALDPMPGYRLGKDKKMYSLFLRTATALVRDRKGISALEYAILAAAILGAISATIGSIHTDVSTLFNNLKSTLDNAVNSF
jgi:Flp pilus assembly pilin Flp